MFVLLAISFLLGLLCPIFLFLSYEYRRHSRLSKIIYRLPRLNPDSCWMNRVLIHLIKECTINSHILLLLKKSLLSHLQIVLRTKIVKSISIESISIPSKGITIGKVYELSESSIKHLKHQNLSEEILDKIEKGDEVLGFFLEVPTLSTKVIFYCINKIGLRFKISLSNIKTFVLIRLPTNSFRKLSLTNLSPPSFSMDIKTYSIKKETDEIKLLSNILHRHIKYLIRSAALYPRFLKLPVSSMNFYGRREWPQPLILTLPLSEDTFYTQFITDLINIKSPSSKIHFSHLYPIGETHYFIRELFDQVYGERDIKYTPSIDHYNLKGGYISTLMNGVKIDLFKYSFTIKSYSDTFIDLLLVLLKEYYSLTKIIPIRSLYNNSIYYIEYSSGEREYGILTWESTTLTFYLQSSKVCTLLLIDSKSTEFLEYIKEYQKSILEEESQEVARFDRYCDYDVILYSNSPYTKPTININDLSINRVYINIHCILQGLLHNKLSLVRYREYPSFNIDSLLNPCVRASVWKSVLIPESIRFLPERLSVYFINNREWLVSKPPEYVVTYVAPWNYKENEWVLIDTLGDESIIYEIKRPLSGDQYSLTIYTFNIPDPEIYSYSLLLNELRYCIDLSEVHKYPYNKYTDKVEVEIGSGLLLLLISPTESIPSSLNDIPDLPYSNINSLTSESIRYLKPLNQKVPGTPSPSTVVLDLSTDSYKLLNKFKVSRDYSSFIFPIKNPTTLKLSMSGGSGLYYKLMNINNKGVNLYVNTYIRWSGNNTVHYIFNESSRVKLIRWSSLLSTKITVDGSVRRERVGYVKSRGVVEIRLSNREVTQVEGPLEILCREIE